MDHQGFMFVYFFVLFFCFLVLFFFFFNDTATTEIYTLSLHDALPISTYLHDTAIFFHKFYAECHVITDDAELTNARIALVSATRIILANGLGLLGISSPEKM